MDSTNGRHLNSPESEKAVLGSVLIDVEAFPVVTGLLASGDFYSGPHNHIFAAMQRLAGAGTPIDLVTLGDELRKAGRLEEVGGVSYLSSLEQYVITTANVAHHAGIVKDKKRNRRVLDRLLGAVESMQSGETDARAIAESLRDLILSNAGATSNRGRSFGAGEYLARKASYPIPGSIWFDGVLNGATVNVLGATTSLGKTFMALQFAMCVAGGLRFLGQQTARARVLFVQCEIVDALLIERLEIMLTHLLADLDCDAAAGVRESIFENLIVRDRSSSFHLWAGSGADSTRAELFLADLRRDIEEHCPSVLILDPYSKVFRVVGPWEIRPALEVVDSLAEEFGLCNVITAHWNKASRGVGDVNLEQVISGGVALVDDASAVLNLTYLPKTPIAESHARLTFDKVRYREKPEPIILRRPCREERLFKIDPTVPIDVPAGRARKGEAEMIAALRFGGPMAHNELKREIMQRSGCGERQAKIVISEGVDNGTVFIENGLYREG
jgi:hypothetical protein